MKGEVQGRVNYTKKLGHGRRMGDRERGREKERKRGEEREEKREGGRREGGRGGDREGGRGPPVSADRSVGLAVADR